MIKKKDEFHGGNDRADKFSIAMISVFFFFVLEIFR